MSANALTITDFDYTLTIRARTSYEANPAPRVYVSDAVADTRSETLVDLERQERALGEMRFAERGTHVFVDDLYDRLNAEIMRVKTEIAREVLAELGGITDGDIDTAVDRAWFSHNAGCDMCPCSPGVVAGARLTWNGGEFDVWAEAA
jgi:hypothetical protein